MKREIDHSPRRGFTLVEVLVVIAIIGLLVALLLPAVNSARRRAKMTRIKADMLQIQAAIERVRTELGGGEYPPDGALTGSDVAAKPTADVMRFCRRAFPRTQWASNAPNTPPLGQANYPLISPDTALVFWLGGVQDRTGLTSGAPASASPKAGVFVGFSANPTNPFDNCSNRIGPFFEFDTALADAGSPTTSLMNRMAANLPQTTLNGTNGISIKPSFSAPASTMLYCYLYQYYPQNDKLLNDSPQPHPYIYFKPVAQAYTSTPTNLPTVNSTSLLFAANTGVMPFLDASSGTASNVFMNPKGFQLLCPGMDGFYGTYPNPAASTPKQPLYPSGANYVSTGYTEDDMTNFTSGPTVADDKP